MYPFEETPPISRPAFLNAPLHLLLPGYPPLGLAMLLGYAVLFTLMLLGLKQLFLPLIEQGLAIAQGRGNILPGYYYFKLLPFLLFSLGGLALLRFHIEAGYLFQWAQHLPRPHPLHVDYHPAQPYSTQALAKWQLYKVFRIVAPPLLSLVAFVLAAWLAFVVFSAFLDTPLMRQPLLYMLGLFLLLGLGGISVVLMLNALLQSVSSTFGACMAITEPFRAMPTIFERCQRLLPHAPALWLLLGVKALLVLGWLGVSVWLLLNFELRDAFAPSVFPYGRVLLYLAALWLVETLSRFATLVVYHHALQNFYRALPPYIQQAFTPPPSIVEATPTP